MQAVLVFAIAYKPQGPLNASIILRKFPLSLFDGEPVLTSGRITTASVMIFASVF